MQHFFESCDLLKTLNNYDPDNNDADLFVCKP